jgi:hypothetical protein
MSRLTLVSTPKPFTDERIALIQSNALESWSQLHDVKVLLMGQAEGLGEAARRVGATHIPDVAHNRWGTPLVSSMMEKARLHCESSLLCLVNADMIIMEDLLDAALRVASITHDFLLVGQRWDVLVEQPLDFSRGWEDRFRAAVRQRGELHRPAGSDFFVFPRHLYEEVPDFAIGRAGWDNWMIHAASQRRIRVVDCTPSVMVVHQNHDYGHLPGGLSHHGLPESDENIRLAGGVGAIRYTLLDATHVFRDGKLMRPMPSTARFLRLWERLLRRAFFFLPAPAIEEIARPRRWGKRMVRMFKGDRAGRRHRLP